MPGSAALDSTCFPGCTALGCLKVSELRHNTGPGTESTE